MTNDYWGAEALEKVQKTLAEGGDMFSTIPVEARDEVAKKIERGFALRKPFHTFVPDIRKGISVLSMSAMGGGAINHYSDREEAEKTTKKLEGMSPEFANAAWID